MFEGKDPLVDTVAPSKACRNILNETIIDLRIKAQYSPIKQVYHFMISRFHFISFAWNSFIDPRFCYSCTTTYIGFDFLPSFLGFCLESVTLAFFLVNQG